MSFDRSVVYESSEHFFHENGSAIMKLTPSAAVEVCDEAAQRGCLVIRIEGGILHYPGFEARLDCIWDSKIDPPVGEKEAHRSNVLGGEFIRSESNVHNAFITTVAPITGDRKTEKVTDLFSGK